MENEKHTLKIIQVALKNRHATFESGEGLTSEGTILAEQIIKDRLAEIDREMEGMAEQFSKNS